MLSFVTFFALLLGMTSFWFGSLFAVLPLCLLLGYHWKWIYVAIRTTPRDLRAGYCYANMLWVTKKYGRKDCVVPDIFHEVVQRHPSKTCYLYENETWTYRDVEQFSLRVSAVLLDQGVNSGETVAVMMSNCPQLPATWLGVARIGAISALINTSQTGSTLIHSINIVNSDVVIYEDAFENVINDIIEDIKPSVKLFKYNHRPLKADRKSVSDANDFTSMLDNTAPMPWRLSTLGFTQKILYIYTSGTTGLPKAAVMTTSRLLFMAAGMFYTSTLKSDDIIYCPLPFYHSSGGVMTVGIGLIFGCTVAIRAKFSASQYFPDCIKYNATAAQYVGEICRYILTTPVGNTDKQHNVRIVYGNGMRPAIWKSFVKRFNIKRVVEFYGATEGNANITNIDNKEGSVGFMSRISPRFYPISIIKIDQETGEPIRDAQGLCQPTAPNEPGMFVGIIDTKNPFRQFHGYVNKKDSDKKIIRNVFKNGDIAFQSGDILIADELGYLYFHDRTGDTFRWKGENVSTTEVETVVSRIVDLKDAVVYGVEIPNTEGRAGMCGILDTSSRVDMDKLSKDITKDLPKYARPIFIRLLSNLDITATFKMKKLDLQREGFDPSKVKDKLYYLDPVTEKYIVLGPKQYEKITSGETRL